MERNGDIEVENNNWFEILVKENGETHSTDIIAHTYPEAMSKFKSEVK